MEGNAHDPSRLQPLIDQFLDGTLSDEDRGRLEAALLEREENVDRFLDFCQLHIDLTIDLHADQALSVFQHGQQQISASASSPTGIAMPLIPDSTSNAFEGSDPSVGESVLRMPGFLSLGIALCSLMLVAAAGLLWWAKASESLDREPILARQLQIAQSPSVKVVRLAAGTTTLELADIGSVLVEGPADFRLIGPMRARLNHGRIKVHVSEPSGHGFVVETPHGEITDLGTEFGVDVAEQIGTGLVVFQGMVDLRLGESEDAIQQSRVERLLGGDGVRFSKIGQLDRITSVVTANDGTFRLLTGAESDSKSIIANVSDNIRNADMKKFYEIVPGGMQEDAQAYVDRQEHEWNGLTKKGMPEYLIGADYVKTFNNDKVRQDLEIEVALRGPARLFVIWDDRLPPTEWLKRDFQRFGDRIGLDMGNAFDTHGAPITQLPNGVGPGQSIDQAFSIWERKCDGKSTVKLGSTGVTTTRSGMYGIAAVALPEGAEVSSPPSSAAQAQQPIPIKAP